MVLGKNEIIDIPVVVYPQEYLDELQKDIDEVREKLARGKQPIFDSVDSMIEALEKS